MSRQCPKCDYGDSSRERRPNGKTTCNACGYSVLSQQWDEESSLHSTMKALQINYESQYKRNKELIVEIETLQAKLELATALAAEWVLKAKIAQDKLHDAELISGVSCTLRGNPLEIQARMEALQEEMECYRADVIDSYELKLAPRMSVYTRALISMRAAARTSESNASDAAEGTKKKQDTKD